MSNAKTGLWSAIGALLGGAAGAAAGKYAVEARPRYRYAGRGRPGGSEVEDAMVVGGAAGAVLGAFIGGTASGEDPPPRNWPALSRPLALAPLVRTAALAHGRIVWTEAVWLARRGEAAPRLGPFGATELAQLLGPPAPIAVLSARLAQRSDESMAQSILRLLLEEEALSERTADQLAAMASNA